MIAMLAEAGVNPYMTLPSEDMKDQPQVITSCINIKDCVKLITILYPDYGQIGVEAYINKASSIRDFLTKEQIPYEVDNEKLIFSFMK